MRWVRIAAVGVIALGAWGADVVYMPLADGRSVVQGVGDERRWNTWVRERDRGIRARLEQGELDSMVNLLLFGTSFTAQPRIRIEELTEASKSGVLRARVDDLLKSVRSPGSNERLIFLRKLLERKTIGLEGNGGGVFILRNLERVLKELQSFAERTDKSQVFRDRGVSLDTSMLPGLAIERALRELKDRGLIREGAVARAAVIGPGLDFVDWDEGYDYYPQQTIQPFALYDSLARVGLAKDARITVFDMSARVLDHLQRARDRAKRGDAYEIQLPRDAARLRAAEVVQYWRAFGDRVGAAVQPIAPPAVLKDVEARAVRIRPEVVLALEPVDLNIVAQRVQGARFDLIVATNVLVYYDTAEQGLALRNIAAMLGSGGLFLVNSELPPGGAMRLVGSTVAPSGDRLLWYQKQ